MQTRKAFKLEVLHQATLAIINSNKATGDVKVVDKEVASIEEEAVIEVEEVVREAVSMRDSARTRVSRSR